MPLEASTTSYKTGGGREERSRHNSLLQFEGPSLHDSVKVANENPLLLKPSWIAEQIFSYSGGSSAANDVLRQGTGCFPVGSQTTNDDPRIMLSRVDFPQKLPSRESGFMDDLLLNSPKNR